MSQIHQRQGESSGAVARPSKRSCPDEDRDPKRDPQLLRLRDVASRLQVSVRTVQSWVAAGRLRVIRLSARAVRVSEEALAEFLERAAEKSS